MATVFCFAEKRSHVSQISRILQTAHHQVTGCYSIREAIRQLGNDHFDVVVTDYNTKHKHGLRVLRAAKQIGSAPVVVISRKLAEAFQAGDPYADLYLDEPVNPQELATLVEVLAGAATPVMSPSPTTANVPLPDTKAAIAAA
ncbi:MAG TPA: response regulator [Terriglobales bacterium]|nr:response regulator [Terriglobales bacterium]